MSVLEAMSVGLPLILSNCIGNRDLIDNNGWLYSNKITAINYIRSNINNKKDLYRLGYNSKKLYDNNFTIKRMVNSYFNLYQKLDL